jgi:HSP20 family protein
MAEMQERGSDKGSRPPEKGAGGQQMATQDRSSLPSSQGFARGSFEEVQRRLDRMMRLFDETFPSLSFGRPDIWSRVATAPAETSLFAPPVNVTEAADAYTVSADLPGVEEKEIDISFANGMLSIKGERKQESERQEEDWHVCEQRLGRFNRAFRLPDDVDVEKIAAAFKNGVLSIKLPKRAEAQKKEQRIPITKL